jgi:Zn-dependent M28 family amino/carboxypeptidase
VNNPAFPLNKTVAMINMDMVGRLKEDKLTVGGIGTASEWKNWLEYRNAQAGTLAIQHLQTACSENTNGSASHKHKWGEFNQNAFV